MTIFKLNQRKIVHHSLFYLNWEVFKGWGYGGMIMMVNMINRYYFYIDCFCQNYNYIFSLTTIIKRVKCGNGNGLIVIFKLQPWDQFDYT